MRRLISLALAWATQVATTTAHTAASPPLLLMYGDHWQNSLDLYVPDGGCPPYPLAIYVHGGGWLSGDSSEVAPYVDPLMSRGFAVASLNYRWSNNAVFPAQIQDCKGALRFLRAHADEYALDQSRFGVFGDSAGGHLAALLGTSGGVASLEGDVGGNLEFSSNVQVVADMYGPTDLFALGAILNGPDSIISLLFGWPIQDIIDHIDDPKYADLVALVNSANPITHVTADDPPFRIIHGQDDDMVPPSQSQMLYDALTSAGVPATLILVPGHGHELPMSEYLAAFDFMQQTLNAIPHNPGDINFNAVLRRHQRRSGRERRRFADGAE